MLVESRNVTDWLADFGQLHHGVVHRSAARAVGISEDAIRHRVARGELIRLADGVFRLRDHPPTWRSRLWAALLEAGHGAVTSHRSAARLHELYAYRQTEAVEVLVRRGRDYRVTQGRLHQTRVLDSSHLEVIAGFPCTTLARTIFDLCGDPDIKPLKRPRAREIHVSRMLKVVNDAIRRHGLSVERELAILTVVGKRGRPGTATVRTIFQEMGCRYVPDESELETIFAELVASAGLPRPEKQLDVGDAEGWIGRVDFAWSLQRVVVEIDSSWHDGPLDQRRDALRDARLMAAGWQVLRFRWRDLVLAPDKVLRAVRRALLQPDLERNSGAMAPESPSSSVQLAQVVPFRAPLRRPARSGRRAR